MSDLLWKGSDQAAYRPVHITAAEGVHILKFGRALHNDKTKAGVHKRCIILPSCAIAFCTADRSHASHLCGYIVLSTAHTDYVSTRRLREHTNLACYSAATLCLAQHTQITRAHTDYAITQH